MADTYTTLLDLTKQEVGARNNTWGTQLHNELDALDEAIAGVGSISTAGGSTTLTKAQARERIQRVTGTLSSNATINVPATTSWYIFLNDTTGAYTVTVQPSGGSGATIAQGTKNLIRSDGSTVTVFEFGAASGSFQPLDSELTALAGLTSAADKLPYFTGSGTAALADFSSFGRSLVDDANASAARTTLGLGTAATSNTGDFQAADAELAAIAGLTSAADRLPYFTGSGTAALAVFTAAARSLLDDATAADMRTTLGITDANIQFNGGAAYGNLSAGLTLETAIKELEDEKGTASGDVTGKVNRTGDTFTGDVGFGDSSFKIYLSGSDAFIQFATGDYEVYDRTNNDWTLFIGGVARLFVSGSTAQIGGNTIWHAGNDGASSGLDADTLRATTPSTFGLSLLDDADAATARSTLGLGTAATSASTAFQSADATLTALAGVTTAADKLIYATGSDTFTTTDFTSTARSLLDDTSTSAMRTTLGLAIGTDVQGYDAQLAAIAGLAPSADTFPYFTGATTATLATVTSFARSLLDDGDAGTARATLGLGTAATSASSAFQAADAELSALAGLTSAADALPYFTGAGTAATTTLTSTARSLLDDASTSAMRATLGLVIGTDVQAYDAELAAIAGLTSAADKVPYFTGIGAAAVADFTASGRALVAVNGVADRYPYFSGTGVVTLGTITSFARSILDDADAATVRATIGAGTSSTTGTVTSVATSGGIAGGTITGSGTITLDTNNNGGVGQLLLMQNVSGGAIGGGDTIAGASLKFLDINTTGFVPTVTSSGTWRNVNGATVAHNDIGFFIRTAT